MSSDEFTGPTTELLQELIRNRCVNDGSPDSGEEVRNADLLTRYLEGAGLDVERFDATSKPSRASGSKIAAHVEPAGAVAADGTGAVPVGSGR